MLDFLNCHCTIFFLPSPQNTLSASKNIQHWIQQLGLKAFPTFFHVVPFCHLILILMTSALRIIRHVLKSVWIVHWFLLGYLISYILRFLKAKKPLKIQHRFLTSVIPLTETTSEDNFCLVACLLWPNKGINPNHLIYLILSYLYSKGIISDKITSFWNYYFKSYLTWCVFSLIFKCLITSIWATGCFKLTVNFYARYSRCKQNMTISEEYFVFTAKDWQNVFPLHGMSGQKNFIQSLLAIIIKRQLL